MKRYCKKFIRDDRGSAIVVVLVAMTFIVVLASILLYLSLVNIQMKNIDRLGKESFYDAESVMNEVRAQVQVVVSEAINTAYTDVLNNYNIYEDDNDDKSIDDERETAFQSLFYVELNKSAIFTEDGTAYDPEQLAVLLGLESDVEKQDDEKHNDNITISSDSCKVSKESDGIKLESVKVELETKDGFYTSVKSDIKIKTPRFQAISASVMQVPVPDFTIIAKNELRVESPNNAVAGNAYAGQVTVWGNGSDLQVSKADKFVCAGDVIVEDGAHLTILDDALLWASGVILNGGNKEMNDDANFELDGAAYIANDLNLHGAEAKAVLKGQYFGYGNSLTEADQSSSIIVNGLNTSLDMSNVKALVLAGHSFVNYGNNDVNPNQYVMMGQSIAVKSDQLAYLLPEEYLNVSNPFSYTSEEYPDGLTNSQLATEDFINMEKFQDETLGNYGIKDSLKDILYMREHVGQTHLIYFCFKFPTDDETKNYANKYFADYFSEHAEDIQKYLNIYCDLYDLKDNSILGFAGGVYDSTNPTDDAPSVFRLINDTAVPDINFTTRYANLCATLSLTDDGKTEDGGDPPESPYEYYVNTTELSGLNGGTKYYPEGSTASNAQVIVADCDVTIDASDAEHVHLVIASGDVKVNSDFTGLIIAKGNIELNASVTADRDKVSDALEALKYKDDNNRLKYYYFNFRPSDSGENENSNDNYSNTGWDMNALVSYENWTKNEA